MLNGGTPNTPTQTRTERFLHAAAKTGERLSETYEILKAEAVRMGNRHFLRD